MRENVFCAYMCASAQIRLHVCLLNVSAHSGFQNYKSPSFVSRCCTARVGGGRIRDAASGPLFWFPHRGAGTALRWVEHDYAVLDSDLFPPSRLQHASVGPPLLAASQTLLSFYLQPVKRRRCFLPAKNVYLRISCHGAVLLPVNDHCKYWCTVPGGYTVCTCSFCIWIWVWTHSPVRLLHQTSVFLVLPGG